MFMGNNEIQFDTKDIIEHCLSFATVNQFKTQAEIDKMKADGEPELLGGIYKVKDPPIKEKCSTMEWKQATASKRR